MSVAAVDALVVLELLARGAPLRAVLDRLDAERAGAHADDVARLDALAAAATELALSRDADRRQVQAMSLLSDTVADLAALHEIDAVLQAICDRARTLLGTDVAYLTLLDGQRGDTYVRATAGVVSDAFRAMRLDPGVGLGGLVAERGISAVTADYASDARFAHTRHVDDLVSAEGLRAIVGVPLRRGDEVLGVLFSAARTVRPFVAGDVVLFETLALHAAIAIENARLFERERASVAELERTGAQLRHRNAEAEQAAALHARLAALVAEGGSADELVAELAALVGGELILVEAEDGAGPEGTVDVPVGAEAARLRWRPREADGAEQRRFGTELVERGAVVVAGQLVAQRARSDADHRRRAAFVTMLLGRDEPDERTLRREAARLGLALDDPTVVLVVDAGEDDDRWLGLRISRSAAQDGGAAGEVGGRPVILVPGADAAAVAARWEPVLRGSRTATPAAGVSEPATGIAALRAAHGEARDALGLHRALGHDRGLTHAGNPSLFSLVFGKGPPDGVPAFVARVLGPLLDHDAAHAEPVLVPVLEAYLAEGAHAANTAKRLGLHVNTVYQRLERIAALTGERWTTADGRLELQFAVRVRALARSLDASRA